VKVTVGDGLKLPAIWLLLTILGTGVGLHLGWRGPLFLLMWTSPLSGAVTCLLWFICGYMVRRGFWPGLLVGLVGAVPGILLSSYALYLLICEGGARPCGAMLPWVFPYRGLVQAVAVLCGVNGQLAHLYLQFATVPVAILLLALGSWVGQRRSAAGRTA